MCVRIVYVSFAVVVCVSELFKLVRYMVTVRGRHIVFLLIKYIFFYVCLVFYGAFIKCTRLIYASQQAMRVDNVNARRVANLKIAWLRY